MSKAISCREAFTTELQKQAEKNSKIIALTSDGRGSAMLTAFANALPNQFVEVGIAEQNEIGIAAGLASVGMRPYVCAPACFLSARSLEQIKVDVAYSNQNVKIFGVSGGISYGALGATHHSLHDIAVMRTFYGLTVIIPCDDVQTSAMLNAIEKTDNPTYIRVGREPVPRVYKENQAPFEIGKANVLKQGDKLTIIACGEPVWYALQAAEKLSHDGIEVAVIDMHTLKPLDEEIIIKAAKNTRLILTVEEHSIYGGLGAAVAQVTAKNCPILVESLGLPDEYIVTGKSGELFKHYGMDTEGIFNTVQRLLKRKEAVY